MRQNSRPSSKEITPYVLTDKPRDEVESSERLHLKQEKYYRQKLGRKGARDDRPEYSDRDSVKPSGVIENPPPL